MIAHEDPLKDIDGVGTDNVEQSDRGGGEIQRAGPIHRVHRLRMDGRSRTATISIAT